MNKNTDNRPSRTERLRNWATSRYEYVTATVWADPRDNWRVNTLKVINLTVRSIFDTDLQSVACAMTYRTVLALVPMLAMVFAVCRGFGFENLLTDQLYNYFPSQHQALAAAMRFVDSYLSQASEGVFVGVGIVFLLWTVVSLLSSVEASFNKIWHVPHGRTIWRQATDYMGIMLVLPVLIICSSGITVMLDTTLKRLLPYDFLNPAMSLMFELISFGLVVLFFAATYMLLPNTKVRAANALWTGLLTAVAYTVLQWLFVTGQMYVSKYNAIYGSFSFLPLFLIWLQLVWLFTYIGAVVCYASQNFGRFDYQNHIADISINYRLQLTVAVAAVISSRYDRGLKPLDPQELSELYSLPLGAVDQCYATLLRDRLIVRLAGPDGRSDGTVVPSRDMSEMTVGELVRLLLDSGDADFIDNFSTHFPELPALMREVAGAMAGQADKLKLTTIVK